VEFTITKDGSVKDPKVIQANPERIFDRSVLRAIRQWKFNPRNEGGKLVEWRAQKEFVFRLKSR
jgi:protein TonB